jgi:autotransporter-associated beta strand protein
LIRRAFFVLGLYLTAASVSASVVWNGPIISFTKPSGADWTQAANQDRMASDVWITRANTQGIFNIAPGFETSYTHSFSPQNTEWAYGTLANFNTLTYTNWESWNGQNPPSMVGQDAVLHLISDDIYMSIKFTSWGVGLQGANGFSYVRSTLGPSTWTGTAGDGNWSSAGNWDSAPVNGSNLIFAGTATSPSPTNDSDLTSIGSITFDTSASAFTLAGTGGGANVNIAGGITNNSTNTQTVNLGLTLTAAQQFNSANGSLAVNGAIATGGNALTVLGPSAVNLGGAISGTGSLSKSGTGTLTVAGNNTYGGGTTVNDTGTLIVAHVNALGTGALSINNTATAKFQAGLSAPVQLPSLTIAGGVTPTATLDVTNNNMVIHSGSITATLAQLKSGLNASGTLWTGTGIQSSTAAADAAANSNSTVFAVGAIKNIDKNGNLIYSTWPAPPSPDTGATGLATTDVLVKYTYFGDADLNGVVDNTTDYDLWSNGFTDPGLAATNGWLYGDFDFSGIVDNTTDYDLWSTGFAHQGGPLSGAGDQASAPASVQAVPEPSAWLLAIFGLMATVLLSHFPTRAEAKVPVKRF